MSRLLVGPLMMALGCAAAGSDGAGPSGPTQASKVDSSAAAYQPSQAATYADGHWDDGQGLCAEFTSRSLRAGSLDVALITYVPTLVDAFAHIPYDEHAQGATPKASTGDVVVYSDATGAAFCANDADPENCGHVCIVVAGGSGEGAIEVDCHNNAHYHLPLGDILGGGYSTYRVYHLTKTSPPNTVPCTTDYDCNQGVTGTEDVCAAGLGYCIRGCHSDTDCATGLCAPTQPHWSCQ